MKIASALAVVIVLVMSPVVAWAAPFDGSTPMRCAIKTVMVCNDPSVCVRGTSATVNLPPVLVVDVANKIVGGSAIGRTVKMVSVGHDGGRLLLHGVENGIAGISWSMVVAEDSGNMSASVLGHGGGGYILFGACAGA